MIELLRTILQYKCGLETYRPVVTGVSGGPDSLVLLDILYHFSYPVIVAHLNHLIRPEGEREASLVQKFAIERNLPYVIKKADVPAYASEHNLSIEEAARAIRYGFLFNLANERRAQAVVVGHTADDQVETVLMHLLRGTGLGGLKGMSYSALPNPWSEDIPLVRPLLGIWRSDILAYIHEHGLQPAEDLSNLDVSYLRNRVRHELIPLLETYNPGIRRQLWRTADIVKGDVSIVQNVIDKVWKNCLEETGRGYLSFRITDFREQEESIQRHLLVKSIRYLQPGVWDIDYGMIDRCVQFVASAKDGAQTEISKDLRMFLELDILWMATRETEVPSRSDWPQIAEQLVANLGIPGPITLPSGWKFVASQPVAIDKFHDQYLDNADPYKVWIDADLVVEPIILRGRVSGDRIKPLGMANKTVKISDLMINLKIPKRARKNWPVLCDAKGVIWVPGLRMSNRVRVRPNTRRVIQFSVSKNHED